MVWGAWANAAITGLAAFAYGMAAMAAIARQRSTGRYTRSVPVLFGIVTLYLLVAALRQVAAALSGQDEAFVAWDRGLYYAVIVPAAFVIVPHMHLVSYIRWGSKALAGRIAAVFAALVAVGLAFGYAGGLDGPIVSDFGTDWSLRSPVTKILLVGVIMLPGLAGSGLVIAGARKLGGQDRRRVLMVGWSMLAYFVVFTLDAFGLAGIPLLAARLATAGTGLLAWSAYRGQTGVPGTRHQPG